MTSMIKREYDQNEKTYKQQNMNETKTLHNILIIIPY